MTSDEYDEDPVTNMIDWQAPLAADPEARTKAVQIYQFVQVDHRNRPVSEVQAALRAQAAERDMPVDGEWIDLAAQAISNGEMYLGVDTDSAG